MRRKPPRAFAALVAAASCACIGIAGASRPTRVGTSFAANALVVGDVRHQEIDGWGSALTNDREPLISDTDAPPELRARLLALLFRDLRESFVRVFVGDFGPAAGPPPDDGSAGAMTQRVAFVRAARAYGVRIMLTGADAPAPWKLGNSLRVDMESRYGDYLIDWAERLRVLGAPADFIAVGNEVSNPDFFNMTADQAAGVYAQMAKRIHEQGLRLRLVTGDNENFADARRYAEAELAAPLVERYTVAAASHAYSNFGSSEAESQRETAKLARRGRLRLWMTEHLPPGPPPGECGAPGPVDDTIESALALGDDITRLMSGPAEPNAYLTLRAVARDHGPAIAAFVLTPPTADCAAPTPATGFVLTKRYYAEKQYTRAAPRGSFRLGLRHVPDGLDAIAFRSRDGSRSVVVLNPGPRDRAVTLTAGRITGTFTARRTSATENYTRLSLGRYRGRPKRVLVRALSITTFMIRPN
jgi:glycosyl hydrolase family 30